MPSLPERLAPLLATRHLGRAVRFLPQTGSTMADAARWAADGAPHGALVLTEHQTAGRGRHGRAWADEPGESLLLSLVLRLQAPDALGLVPLAAGVALALAIREAFSPAQQPPEVRIKWPNDVLVGGRKVAGVLAEASWSGPDTPPLILGVGVNVGQQRLPPDVAGHATSLRLAGAPSPDRAALLARFIHHLEALLGMVEGGEASALVREAESVLWGQGERVCVSFPGTHRAPVEGVVLGLDPSGALRLGTPEGEVPLLAGEVSLGTARALARTA